MKRALMLAGVVLTSIGYPGGDVPRTIGVCTDVVIRAYRAVGVDLQQLVHDGKRLLVVHNIGNGPEVEDVLFRFPITGHFRYRG